MSKIIQFPENVILSSQVKMELPLVELKNEHPPFRTLSEAFDWSDDETKLKMIWKVAKMETVNSVEKRAIHKMLKWLAEMTLEEY